MKHRNEALAGLALMYILSEFEVDNEIVSKVKILFEETRAILESNNTSIEDVMQEALKVLEKFVEKKEGKKP